MTVRDHFILELFFYFFSASKNPSVLYLSCAAHLFFYFLSAPAVSLLQQIRFDETVQSSLNGLLIVIADD